MKNINAIKYGLNNGVETVEGKIRNLTICDLVNLSGKNLSEITRDRTLIRSLTEKEKTRLFSLIGTIHNVDSIGRLDKQDGLYKLARETFKLTRAFLTIDGDRREETPEALQNVENFINENKFYGAEITEGNVTKLLRHELYYGIENSKEEAKILIKKSEQMVK